VLVSGADGYEVPEIVCDIYFYGQKPCFGGVLALNGRDGSELWRQWTAHEVFALNCNEDITGDGIRDCVMGGRAGVRNSQSKVLTYVTTGLFYSHTFQVFGAVNGKDGQLLWDFGDSPPKNPLMNIYTPQFIRDVNGDQIPDVLAVHGGDPLAGPGMAHVILNYNLVPPVTSSKWEVSWRVRFSFSSATISVARKEVK